MRWCWYLIMISWLVQKPFPLTARLTTHLTSPWGEIWSGIKSSASQEVFGDAKYRVFFCCCCFDCAPFAFFFWSEDTMCQHSYTTPYCEKYSSKAHSCVSQHTWSPCQMQCFPPFWQLDIGSKCSIHLLVGFGLHIRSLVSLVTQFQHTQLDPWIERQVAFL